ncbi:MAG: hypothetical protein HON40_06525 [Flavobacteriales bacterium]|nr:hypothetical protein [Flavobacteriales bacterium]
MNTQRIKYMSYRTLREISTISLILISVLFNTTQTTAQNVYANFDITTSWLDFEEVIDVWTKYVQSEDDSIASQYWNKNEVEKYGYLAYNLNKLALSPNFLEMVKWGNVQIMSIRKIDEYYKIKSHIYWERNDSIRTMMYINVYTKKDQNGDYKLYNAFPINLKKYWNKETVGYIHFYFPKYHQFDKVKAIKQNNFITTTLPEIFGTKPDTVHYVFADTQKEMLEVTGIDFLVGGSGTEKPTGKASKSNNYVHCSGVGEYYPHELFHIFEQSKKYNYRHSWISEGIATFLGGSRGKPLAWHIKKANLYFKNHLEINLSEMINLRNKHIDEYTGFTYVLGGTIIQLIHEKGGWDLVKEFITNKGNNDEYYKGIEDVLGVPQKELNTYIRNELNRLSTK